jgi:hypothetical protein
MRLTTSICGAMLTGFLATLISIDCDSAILCSSAHHAQVQRPQPIGRESTAPADWSKVDVGAFSIFAPSGWKFRQLQGIDSYVGEFIAYVVAHKSIAGLRARIVSPKTPGHGVTGIYFPKTFGSNKLSLFGQDLSAAQQELALRIFETIRFGRTVPSIVVPPPSKNVE